MANSDTALAAQRQESKVDEALDRLRLYYMISVTLTNEGSLAKRMNAIFESLNPDTQAKIRRFASPDKRGYSQVDFEEMLHHCKRKQYPLGFQLIERLMSIHTCNDRKRLQKQMVENHWSKSELNRQIILLRGSRTPKAGRRMEKLRTAASILPELQRLTSQWLQRRDGIDEHFAEEVKKWPKGLRMEYEMVTEVHKRLQTKINRYLGQTNRT